MGKKAKKSKKNKAVIVEETKKSLAQEEMNAAAVTDAKAAEPAEKVPAPAVAPAEKPAEKKKAKTKEAAVKKTVKKTEKKAAKKIDAGKTAAKKAGAKPGRKPMTEEEKAANAKARAAEKEKAEHMTPTLTLQYGGRDVDVKALVQAAKDDFKAKHKRTFLTELNLYLKPEDSTLYYVANGSEEGKIKF